MLTQEQFKNLKPGDIIDIRGFVNLPLSNGNILVELRYEFDHRTLPAYQRISTEFISLPPEQPKHDPTRPFKKGDRVSPMFWNERPPVASEERINSEFMPEDGVYDVLADEKNSIVYIDYHGKPVFIPACHLELISPVEELVPYSVEAHEDGECGCFEVMRRKQCVSIYPYGTHETRYYKKAEQAKAAAEAECKRLNDEYGKE